MKKSVIKELFNKTRGGFQQIALPDAQRKLSRVVSDAYGELSKQLTPEQLRLLQAFTNALENEFIEGIDNHYVH